MEHDTYCSDHACNVKLNNPLMGTETHIFTFHVYNSFRLMLN